jgi:hypothetical protein
MYRARAPTLVFRPCFLVSPNRTNRSAITSEKIQPIEKHEAARSCAIAVV